MDYIPTRIPRYFGRLSIVLSVGSIYPDCNGRSEDRFLIHIQSNILTGTMYLMMLHVLKLVKAPWKDEGTGNNVSFQGTEHCQLIQQLQIANQTAGSVTKAIMASIIPRLASLRISLPIFEHFGTK